jgi:hypothetical protein
LSQKNYQLNEVIGQNSPANTNLSKRVGAEDLGFEIKQLESGVSNGVQLVTLHCGSKSVDVIPTRGMGIWQAKNSGIRFGFDSPVAGPVHPAYVPLSEPSGLGWLGGFDELVVRCGLTSNGAPEFDDNGTLRWPLHGRIANLPATEVEMLIDEDAGTISISGTVVESRFHFYRWQLRTTITLHRDSDEIEISDHVTNLSDRIGSFQLLYHCNFGPPILEDGSRFYAPVKTLAPRDSHAARGVAKWDRFTAPDARYVEEVYFFALASDHNEQTLTLLANADRSLGATVRYFSRSLPCFSLWKNTVGMADGYVAGLEPGTNFPNPRGFEESHDRTVFVQPGDSVECQLAIGLLVEASAVQAALAEIDRLKPAETTLVERPLADWSAPE